MELFDYVSAHAGCLTKLKYKNIGLLQDLL